MAAAPVSPRADLNIEPGDAQGPTWPLMGFRHGPSSRSYPSPSCPGMLSKEVPLGLSHDCACTERQSNLSKVVQQGGDRLLTDMSGWWQTILLPPWR